MKRRGTSKLVALVATGLAASLIAACGSGGESDGAIDSASGLPEDYELTITYSAIAGPDHWFSGGVTAFQEAIEERSGGRITFDIHWAGALVPVSEHTTSVRDGVIDMAVVSAMYEPERYPILRWLGTVSHDVSPSTAIAVPQALAAGAEMGHSEAIRDEFLAQDVQPLIAGWMSSDSMNLMCAEPITSASDLSGRLVRVPGPEQRDEVQSFGAEPVEMPPGEVYEALQRGTVDCVVGNLRDAADWGWHEVLKQVVVDPEENFTGSIGNAIVVNQDFWSDMPDAAKKIIWDSLPAFMGGFLEKGMAADDGFVEASIDKRLDFSPLPDAARNSLAALHKKWQDTALSNIPENVDEASATQAFEVFAQAREEWAAYLGDDLGLGELPVALDEYVAAGGSEGIDFESVIDAIEEKLITPNFPNGE